MLGLVRGATQADGVAPLSEQVLLAVQDPHPDPTSEASSSGPASSRPASATGSPQSGHLLAYSAARLAGYAHLERDVAVSVATAEVVVDPISRREGVGTELIRTLENAVDDAASAPGTPLRLWSHGDLEGARALALRRGYSIVRELWQMRRPLRPGHTSLPEATLPQGFRARPFVVGRDEEAWLRVNARAFVDHPEQGRMTRHDLDQRIAEPWFDASGFILIEDVGGPTPVLAASHWTKIAAADAQTGHPAVRPTEGEVYVVGVDPPYQGLGLGRSVTVLGLAHLREKGLTEAMLYVDADNEAAVATYSRLDFTRSAVDIMYSRIVDSDVRMGT